MRPLAEVPAALPPDRLAIVRGAARWGWDKRDRRAWFAEGGVGADDLVAFLYLADRRTDLIISGGVNIWPAEVAAASLRHPAVRSCVGGMGAAHADLGHSVHPQVEVDAGAISLTELGHFPKPWLAREKRPRSLDTQTHPGRADAGKVRKAGLAPARQTKEWI